jgi:WD40 repeat protein
MASSTVEILVDAYQFARHNQYIADLAPLQLYASALVFAPDLSLIKTLFKSCMPSWLSSRPRIEGTWRSDVLKFEGHTSYIMAIAFSPDDKLLGTCSRDGTARVWDTTDAGCSLTVSHDKHGYYSGAIAFSLDNSKVAVAYIRWKPFGEDAPINVVVTIYAKTGMPLRTMQCPGLLLGHGSWLALAFADDEHHAAIVLAVAGIDYVQVWRPVNDSNILIRAWTSHFPNQGKYKIAVALSQDASLLCCSGILGENDCRELSIGVLDPKTGAVTSKHGLHGRDMLLGDLKFSGRTLVYQTTQGRPDRGRLKGFDLGNPGASTHLLEYHGTWGAFSLANAKDRVAFSTFLNFTAYMETIPESSSVGRRIKRLDRRTVAVAPRGNLVADCFDGCLTVLDTRGLVTQTIMANCEGLRCLAISPDCRYIALGHDEGATVWNIETGQHSQYNGIRYQFELAFSDDNKMLACVAVSGIIVWDLESQRMLSRTAVRHAWRHRRLEFSADGKDLLTSRGRFHIATATLTKRPESTTSSVFGKEVGLSGESRNFEWVQFDGEDLLWIPDEYRPSDEERRAARGNTVALAKEDGRATVLTFDPSML